MLLLIKFINLNKFYLKTPRACLWAFDLYYPNFLRMLSNCVFVISSFSV